MTRTFVPIAAAVPTVRRIVQRDGVARLAAVFCVLGLAAAGIYVFDAVRARPSQRAFAFAPAAEPESPIGPSWLVAGLAMAALLPLRVASIRRLFRRGREVVGRVERVGPPRRGAVTVAYAYTFEGRPYSGTYAMTLAATPAFNAEVAVVVDPARPSRSVLKHAYLLEAVDQVPRARVVPR